MDLDDPLCFCFHVSRRKVINYLRICRPRSPSQLSECQGAGTGCGWCRPLLRRLWHDWQAGSPMGLALPSMEQCARRRAAYLRAGKGKPPAPNSPDSGQA